MGKDRAYSIPCRNHHCHVRRTYMETLMTDLEIVLSIAFVIILWLYRRENARGNYYKSTLIAVGLGVVNIEVDADTHTYKLEVCNEIKRHMETKG